MIRAGGCGWGRDRGAEANSLRRSAGGLREHPASGSKRISQPPPNPPRLRASALQPASRRPPILRAVRGHSSRRQIVGQPGEPGGWVLGGGASGRGGEFTSPERRGARGARFAAGGGRGAAKPPDQMVEAGGIEPPSEGPVPPVSPCAACGFISPRRLGSGPRPCGQPVMSRSSLPGEATTQPASRRRDQDRRRGPAITPWLRLSSQCQFRVGRC